MSDTWGSLAPPTPDPILPPPRNPAMPADFAQVAVRKVLGGLANMVMMPKRAMDQGITTEEAIPWAANTAMTLAGTGAPAAVPGAAGIFGGRLAKTADQAALGRAEELARSGVPREQIWNDTGWFKGGDDKWRFEIDDSNAKLSRPSFNEMNAGQSINQKFGEFIDHGDLTKAYPDLANRPLQYVRVENPKPGSPLGLYSPERDAFMVRAIHQDFGNPKSTALHEGQHAIQRREGFSPGSSPEAQRMLLRENTGNPIIEQLRSAIATGKYGMPGEKPFMEAARNLLKLEDQSRTARSIDAYRSAAGEVEARNVQTRMNMTPEERRAKPPWLTEDVPASQQIFGNLAPGGK